MFWNPPLTSQNPHAMPPLLARHLWALVTARNTTSSADLPLTLTYWCRCSRPASCSWSATTFSPIFPMQLIKLIGLQLPIRNRSLPGLGIRTTRICCHTGGIQLWWRLSTISSTSSCPSLVGRIFLISFYRILSGPATDVLEVPPSALRTSSFNCSLSMLTVVLS